MKQMKWPAVLTWIRHGQSAYNLRKQEKLKIPGYLTFVELCKLELAAAKSPFWPSAELKQMAENLFPLISLGEGDPFTPLTDLGWQQARKTGEGLKNLIELPDVVFISDYWRVEQTYQGICEPWPELAQVELVRDPRLQEQNHGLMTLFSDKYLFWVFNPQEALLYQKLGKIHYRYPNGENKYGVRARVREYYSKLIRDYRGKKVLTIAHEITILCHRANQEHWTAQQFIDAEENNPVNCGVTIYKCDPNAGRGGEGKLYLDLYNECLY